MQEKIQGMSNCILLAPTKTKLNLTASDAGNEADSNIEKTALLYSTLERHGNMG